MEPLSKTKQTLIWLHMYPIDDNDDDDDDQWFNKRAIFSRIIIAELFIGASLASIAAVTFSVELASMDLQQSLLAVIPAVSFFNVAYDIVAGLLLRNKIKQIFTKLSEIYSTSKYSMV